MTSRHKTSDDIIARYNKRTRRSKGYHERAQQSLPGGDTRAAVFFSPYPAYIERGEGYAIYDADGNQYIDFSNNYTSLIHGHTHPPTMHAVQAQLERGTIFGSPAVCQHELAEILCSRIPSVERVRFCNSGTEATMVAMRLARAFTGREVILKMDGGYHGTHDFAEVNITATIDSAGQPPLHRENMGVPTCVMDGLMVVHFNDLCAVEETLVRHGQSLAAIIVEPTLNAGGLVSAKTDYLKGLRELATKYGILLIFDEIVTFRLSLGGQQLMDIVEPDLTTLGKIIGGGFPVGAVGGKREIMALSDPSLKGGIKLSGTFNGNNVTMAAGIATLQHYDQSKITRINGLGERLRVGLRKAFRAQGLKGTITGPGSLAYIHWTDGEIATAADAARAAKEAGPLPHLLHLELINCGIWAAPRGEFCISTPMTEREVDHAIAAVADTLQVLQPYVEHQARHLLLD